jgi:NAD-dependent SIR2 family protein deacetylase
LSQKAFKHQKYNIYSNFGGENMEAYCVKCKKKMEMTDAKKTKMRNGREMMKGTCPKCGTGMCRIL